MSPALVFLETALQSLYPLYRNRIDGHHEISLVTTHLLR
jgi:hypothetical protein